MAEDDSIPATNVDDSIPATKVDHSNPDTKVDHSNPNTKVDIFLPKYVVSINGTQISINGNKISIVQQSTPSDTVSQNFGVIQAAAGTFFGITAGITCLFICYTLYKYHRHY